MVLGLEKKMEKEYYGKTIESKKDTPKIQRQTKTKNKTKSKRKTKSYVAKPVRVNSGLDFLGDYGEIYYMRRK